MDSRRHHVAEGTVLAAKIDRSGVAGVIARGGDMLSWAPRSPESPSFTADTTPTPSVPGPVPAPCADRGGATRRLWPALLPQRVALLEMRAAIERTEGGEPIHVDHLFEVSLNDPTGTRLHIPIRVTAAEASLPGHYDEPVSDPTCPDFHHAAWRALARFGAALESLGAFAGMRPFDTPYSRWSGEEAI